MPPLDESRPALLAALDDRYGPMGRSGVASIDGLSPFEAIASAAIGLVAEPRLAAAALGALRDAGLLQAGAFASADPIEIDDLFREARVRLPARALGPLRRIARWAAESGFDAEAAASTSTEALRQAWRALNGVGPATADALLLFGLRRPSYPLDRATYRILARHGWIDASADYDEARSVVEGIAPDDAEALARLSIAFGRVARDACKPSAAHCDRCPLRPFLPEGGPVEAE